MRYGASIDETSPTKRRGMQISSEVLAFATRMSVQVARRRDPLVVLDAYDSWIERKTAVGAIRLKPVSAMIGIDTLDLL